MNNRNYTTDKLLKESKENFRKVKILLIKLMIWKKYVIVKGIDDAQFITTYKIFINTPSLKARGWLAIGTLRQLRKTGWIE